MLQILYFVYKNIAFGLTLFYYNIFTGFSGQDLYDDWYMVMFNVLLTSLPVISLGVLEQDVSSDVCLKVKTQHANENIDFSFLFLLDLTFVLCSFLPSIKKVKETFVSAGSESSVGFSTESWLL